MASKVVSDPPTAGYKKLYWTLISAVIVILAIVFAPSTYRRLATTGQSLHFPQVLSRVIAQRPSTTSVTPLVSATSAMSQKAKALEERQWNSLADRMNQFHNHFRYEFDRVYRLCDGGFQKEGMSLPSFLREAQELHHHLHMHHTIVSSAQNSFSKLLLMAQEEAYIFPVLAKKMPQFKEGARESGQHLQSHRAIHAGLDKYEAFLKASLANPSSYSASTLREIMMGFKDVLFTHLDEEVHDLGAASMKAAGWTLDELRKIPM